jgi:hypothetical protein
LHTSFTNYQLIADGSQSIRLLRHSNSCNKK